MRSKPIIADRRRIRCLDTVLVIVGRVSIKEELLVALYNIIEAPRNTRVRLYYLVIYVTSYRWSKRLN